ncbi:MAG TPA: zinc-dependent alcohol dehydrogenase family protein [Steroidobacteraceae bacterium]|nr:zinc-dependent alcohol dehydrogenase family protein [Steroidobacteraceae bacterium]
MSRAQLCERSGEPLRLVDRPVPEPGPGQVLLKVAACAVCRTDLHVVDGDLAHPGRAFVPGHEIVGTVIAAGPGTDVALGTRLGVPWLGCTCGRCEWCTSGRENLCPAARFTGWQIDGGFAEHAVADARYAFRLPAALDAPHAAPLLCAGLIGWRALKAAGNGATLGLYGFGAAAHLIAQVARWQGRRVHAFTRPGDEAAQRFARTLGVAWAGGSDEPGPAPLDAAILFAPVGALVPAALRAVKRGGTVVCAGIHMSEIPAFPYALLWGERVVRSVANLTRRDALEFLALAPRVGLRVEIETHPLASANEALARLRRGEVAGAAVLIP